MDDLASGASAKIAAHVAHTRYEDLSPAVIHAFKRALLDHVTCAVAGSAMPVSRALLSYFQENDASRVATVIAGSAKLSAANAALVNGANTHGLDFDDGHTHGSAHPSGAIFPAMLAAAEQYGATPQQLVLAVVLGYDVMVRIAAANNVEMGRINFSKETNFGSSALYERWMTKGDVEEGDVLITMEAPLGNIAQVPDARRYILSQRVVLLRPKPESLVKEFLALQMMGARFQQQLVRHSTGSTAVGIQRAKLETIDLAFPQDLAEQRAIKDAIHVTNERIEADEHELRKMIFLKSGLMTDLLTGRVRVPEHVEVSGAN